MHILSSYNTDSSELQRSLHKIDTDLVKFLKKEGIFSIWDKINCESKTHKQFELQFHKWFDNLKTLRLLKFYS